MMPMTKTKTKQNVYPPLACMMQHQEAPDHDINVDDDAADDDDDGR